MKNFLLALLLPISLSAQTGYSIKGNIKGLKDSTLVFLVSGADGATLSQDYAFNGQFNLKGKMDNADIYLLNFIGHKETVDMFIGNENVVVTGEATKLKSVTVGGSKLHSDYAYYLQVKEETVPSIMQARQIVECIRLLPLGYRTVLNLFALEGYSHKEIGAMLDIEESTSRSQYTRSKAMLEAILIKKKILDKPQEELSWAAAFKK